MLGREQAHVGIRHRPGDRLPDVLGLALIQDGLMTTTAPMLRFPNHDEHPAIPFLKIPPDYSTSGASGSLSGLGVALRPAVPSGLAPKCVKTNQSLRVACRRANWVERTRWSGHSRVTCRSPQGNFTLG